MKKLLLLFCFQFLFSLQFIYATHIVGGGFKYRYIGGNSYAITLEILKDCGANIYSGFDGSTNLDGTSGVDMIINVFKKSDNSFISQVTGLVPVINFVTDYSIDSCFNPSNFCIKRGVYNFNITVPDSRESYYITYTRCCRNGVINNLVSPLSSGTTYTIEIPPIAIYENNSCTYNYNPILNTKILDTFIINLSVADIDGDSIYYSLCPAFDGASEVDPYILIGSYINSAPYLDVNYQSPFSYLNPMNNSISEAIQIDPTTGILKGYPTMNGVYLISVCATEYRFGQELCTNKREFELLVGNGLRTVLQSPDTLYSCLSFQPAMLQVESYSPFHNIVWLSSADGFSIPINGSFGTTSGLGYFVNPTITTIYKGIIVDTITRCYSKDTVQVVVIPYSNEICDSLYNLYYSIDDNRSQFNFEVFPNPTSDLLNISLSSFDKNSQLSLVDIYGNTHEKVFINKNKFEFSMSNYPKGFYTLVLENNKSKIIKKVIYY